MRLPLLFIFLFGSISSCQKEYKVHNSQNINSESLSKLSSNKYAGNSISKTQFQDTWNGPIKTISGNTNDKMRFKQSVNSVGQYIEEDSIVYFRNYCHCNGGGAPNLYFNYYKVSFLKGE